MSEARVAGMRWDEFLAERRLGVLATAGADGDVHAVPVEVVVDGGRVYAWTKSRSIKARNARRSGRASLVAYKMNDGVLVRGPARLLSAADEDYERITGAFLAKYEREETYGNDALIEITPERVTVFD